jgi:hypothetical protein
VYKPYKDESVSVEHRYIAGKKGKDADDLGLVPEKDLNPEPVSKRFTENGSIIIELPPSSVSNILISKQKII